MKLKDLFRRKSKTTSSSQSSQSQPLSQPVPWFPSRPSRRPSPPPLPPRQLPPLPLRQPSPPTARDPSPPPSPPPSYSLSPPLPPRHQSPPLAVRGPPPLRRRQSSPTSPPLREPSPPPLPQPSPPRLRQRRSLPLTVLEPSPNAPDTKWTDDKKENHFELSPNIPRRTPSSPASPVNRHTLRYDPQSQTGYPWMVEAPLTWSWNGSTRTWIAAVGADSDDQWSFSGFIPRRRNSDPSPSLPPPPPLHEPRPLRPSPPLSQRRSVRLRDSSPSPPPPPRRPSPPLHQRRSLFIREAPLPPLPYSQPPFPLPGPSSPSSPPPPPLPSLLLPPPPLGVDEPPPPMPGSLWDLPAVDPPTCPNCGNRPVAPNPATGKYFDYCSRTCAVRARNLKRRGHLDSLCEQCRQKPKLKKGTRVHPYCSLACAKPAANKGATWSNSLWNSTIHGNNNPIPQKTSPGGICRIPGCRSSVYIHPNGTLNKYCTAIHKEWGKRGCVSCRLAPMTATSVLCEACHDYALNEAPVIIEVPKDHKNYKGVKTQFKQTWKHKTTCPDIKVIYKIIVPETSMDQYLQYLDGVEARGNFAAKGKSPGNENRRWHGTKRKCRLGDPGHMAFCAETDCALCCIIKTSFDLKFFKSSTGWGRFGQGIYTSATSSKSNDYSRNVGVNSELKALLLNKVVVGNGKKLTSNNSSLTAPPAGFDSVLGEVGGTLNYDELVVYQNDAVRPSYLVMYKSL